MIAGAGLGGLTAALAMLRAGFTVRVFEQASALGEVGAGISMSPGAARGLASLGIGKQLLAASLPVPDVAFVHFRTSELLAGSLDGGRPQDLGLDGARHIHRADLHAILLAAVRAIDPATVETGRRVKEVYSDSDAIRLTFADGTIAEGQALIAADGSRSTVRSLIFDTSPPDFAGQIAFRCLVPMASAAPYLGKGSAVVTVGPGRIFHRYPIRHGTVLNVVGIARHQEWAEDGWNIRADPAEFLAAYADFGDDVRGLIAAAPTDSLIKWGLFDRPPIRPWVRGRIALLGDAAHPILPFLGLGAALAIEDGIVLAQAMAHFANVDQALAAYQWARYERVETVRTETIRQGRITQALNPDRYDLNRSPSQDLGLFNYDPCETNFT